MLDQNSFVNTPTGFTWTGFQEWLKESYLNTSEKCASQLIYHTFFYEMLEIGSAEECYLMRHAWAMLAAHAVKGYNHVTVTDDIYQRQAKSTYHLLGTVLCSPYPQAKDVDTVMDYVDYAAREYTISPLSKHVLMSIYAQYQRGQYTALSQVRDDLLHYISTVRGSDLVAESKTATIQACCHILTIFH